MFSFLKNLFKKNSKIEEKTKEDILKKNKEEVPKSVQEEIVEEKLPLYDENGDVIAEDYFLAEGMEEGDDR